MGWSYGCHMLSTSGGWLGTAKFKSITLQCEISVMRLRFILKQCCGSNGTGIISRWGCNFGIGRMEIILMKSYYCAIWYGGRINIISFLYCLIVVELVWYRVERVSVCDSGCTLHGALPTSLILHSLSLHSLLSNSIGRLMVNVTEFKWFKFKYVL